MRIIATGLSFKTAPVEIRERMAVPAAKLGCAGCRLKLVAGLAEVVVLSTCNRVEVYGVTDRPAVAFDAESLLAVLAPEGVDPTPHVYTFEGAEAVRHLFSVASGMDSMVLGETEITGQVKLAYEAAQKARLTGRVLNKLFQRAFQAAKDVRTRTSIGRGATSVGSVAVELAEKVFGGDLAGQTVMIVGAGKMGEACVKHLAKKGVRRVLVANRSPERARALAAEFGGEARPIAALVATMAEADIVVSSTGSPETVLRRAEVEAAMAARRQRPLVLIDIAVPRDIAPEVQTVPNVFLHDIDDLETIVRANTRLREQELALARSLLAAHAAEFHERLRAVQGRPERLPAPATGTAAMGWTSALAGRP